MSKGSSQLLMLGAAALGAAFVYEKYKTAAPAAPLAPTDVAAVVAPAVAQLAAVANTLPPVSTYQFGTIADPSLPVGVPETQFNMPMY